MKTDTITIEVITIQFKFTIYVRLCLSLVTKQISMQFIFIKRLYEAKRYNSINQIFGIHVPLPPRALLIRF